MLNHMNNYSVVNFPGHAHYPHISVGRDDRKNNCGFHVTVARGKRIFFKTSRNFPYCTPAIYDRVGVSELWEIFNYAKEFAVELQRFRKRVL